MRSFSEYNSGPPEYKQADYGKSCLNCKYLDSTKNHCTKYDTQVSTNYVCLTWERGDPANNLSESSKKHEWGFRSAFTLLLEKQEYVGPYTYMENPSQNDLIRMLNQASEKELRYAMSKDKKRFFIWDANTAEHNDFRRAWRTYEDDETFTWDSKEWYASAGYFILSKFDRKTINFSVFEKSGFLAMKKLMKQLRYDMTRFDPGAGWAKQGLSLTESVSEAELEAFRMQLATKYTPDRLYLYITRGGDLKLDTIAFKKDKQKQGLGSKLMQELVNWADKKGLRIVLTTGVRDPHWGTTSATRLKKFYKRFGFVENKGRNKDYRISENMFRNPANLQEKWTADIGNGNSCQRLNKRD